MLSLYLTRQEGGELPSPGDSSMSQRSAQQVTAQSLDWTLLLDIPTGCDTPVRPRVGSWMLPVVPDLGLWGQILLVTLGAWGQCFSAESAKQAPPRQGFAFLTPPAWKSPAAAGKGAPLTTEAQNRCGAIGCGGAKDIWGPGV